MASSSEAGGEGEDEGEGGDEDVLVQGKYIAEEGVCLFTDCGVDFSFLSSYDDVLMLTPLLDLVTNCMLPPFLLCLIYLPAYPLCWSTP